MEKDIEKEVSKAQKEIIELKKALSRLFKIFLKILHQILSKTYLVIN